MNREAKARWCAGFLYLVCHYFGVGWHQPVGSAEMTCPGCRWLGEER
jgi:hypothetical protein